MYVNYTTQLYMLQVKEHRGYFMHRSVKLISISIIKPINS